MRPVALRSTLALLTCLLFALPTVSAPTTAPAPPVDSAADGRHMLWRVTTPHGGVGYLLGSIHVARGDLFPLADVYDEAFEQAEFVAFEIDLDKVLSMSFAMVRRGFFWDGRTLEDVLSPALWTRIQEHAAEEALDLTLFRRAKPWMMSLILSTLDLQQEGFTGASGVDQVLFDRAKRAGKERRALETADEQFLFFDGFTPEQQEALLRSALEESVGDSDEIDVMTDAWKRGDVETLDSVLRESGAQIPGLLERLLIERNRNWIPRIEGWLTEGEPFLVVVGAGHLVGEDSVVELLREEGYTVERL